MYEWNSMISPVPPTGMKTGMKGAKKPLLRSRKGPQTVKTGKSSSPPAFREHTVKRSFRPQPQAHAGGGLPVGAVVRQADVLPGGEELLPTVPPHRVQRGEHALLAGLRRVQEGGEQERGGGAGPGHLRRLHLHSITQRGLTAHRSWTFPMCFAQRWSVF